MTQTNTTTATATATDAGNTTNGPAPVGPSGKPGGAPNLPDVVPGGVQDLLNGIFTFGGDIGRGLGDLISGLGRAISGGGAGEAMLTHSDAVLDGVIALL